MGESTLTNSNSVDSSKENKQVVEHSIRKLITKKCVSSEKAVIRDMIYNTVLSALSVSTTRQIPQHCHNMALRDISEPAGR